MKKVLLVLLIVGITFSAVGCRKLVDTKYDSVEVTITDNYHRGMWLQPVRAGKVTTYITHPAVYHIMVEYNGVEYTISDYDIYDKYKDKMGQTTTGILETNIYDDNSVEYDIVEIK